MDASIDLRSKGHATFAALGRRIAGSRALKQLVSYAKSSAVNVLLYKSL